jgi:uncharacterized protein (TIRG00374 family)
MDGPRHTTSGPGAKRTGRARLVATLITLAVLVVVFAGIFPRLADYGTAWNSIQRMSATALTALAVATMVNVTVYPLPFQVALPGVGYWPAFMVRQTSFLISNAVPAGGAVGLGVQYAMLSAYGFGAAATTAAIGASTAWNLFITLGLPMIGVIALVLGAGANAPALVAAAGGLAVLGAMIALFVLILRSAATARRVGEIADRVIERFATRFGRAWEPALAVQIVAFRASVVGLTRHRWHALTLTSVLQQLAQLAILHIAVVGLQGPADNSVTPVEGLVAFAVARVAAFLPVTPGGLGTTDAALVALLIAAGASSGTALAAVLLWRAASFVPQILIGVATFLAWRWRANRVARPA